MGIVDAVQEKTVRRELYMGEDENDMLDDLTLTDIFQIQGDGGELDKCPFVDLNWVRYKASWKPWRRVLI